MLESDCSSIANSVNKCSIIIKLDSRNLRIIMHICVQEHSLAGSHMIGNEAKLPIWWNEGKDFLILCQSKKNIHIYDE